MRSLSLLLLPLALAAPAKPHLPELSVSQWTQIQSGVFDNLKSLSSWSWNKAEEIAEGIEADLGGSGSDETKTIWQLLKEDPNSFSKLTKLIEFEGTAQKVLDDKDLQITFFAPNNDALTPPEHHGDHGHHGDHDHHGHHDHDHHGHHGHDDDEDFFMFQLAESPDLRTLSAALEREPSLAIAEDKGGDDDDERKKRRREMFRKIAGYVLQYHGLTKEYTAAELAQNSTFPTALKAHDGSYGGLHRRIKVEKTFIPPSLKLNGYAKVLVSDIKARNGYIHTLNHPLLPPPSIIEEAFLFPDFFSTATSAVQQVGGRKYLDWSYDHEASKPGHPKFTGVGLTTFFIPTNAAFALLPPRLKFFLFSPFGEKTLAKILMYHSVPRTLLLSEFIYTEKKEKSAWGFSDAVESIEYFATDNDPSFHRELDVGTALPNATLHVEVDKSKFLPVEGAVKISVKVNGEQVQSIDIPARNGAIHVIGKVLVPPHHHDHDGEDVAHLDSWQNWEQWLPKWAAQA